jgi:hypothetical protein
VQSDTASGRHTTHETQRTESISVFLVSFEPQRQGQSLSMLQSVLVHTSLMVMLASAPSCQSKASVREGGICMVRDDIHVQASMEILLPWPKQLDSLSIRLVEPWWIGTSMWIVAVQQQQQQQQQQQHEEDEVVMRKEITSGHRNSHRWVLLMYKLSVYKLLDVVYCLEGLL